MDHFANLIIHAVTKRLDKIEDKIDALSGEVSALKEFKAEVRGSAKTSARWTSILISLGISLVSFMFGGHIHRPPIE